MENTEAVKVTTTSESIRKLLLAHFECDAQGFAPPPGNTSTRKRRKNHQVVARDLERLLATYNGLSVVRGNNGLSPLPGGSRDVPKDKERDVALIEMFEPARRLSDLVLDEPTRKTLERIIDENRKGDLLKTYGARLLIVFSSAGLPAVERRSRRKLSQPSFTSHSHWSGLTQWCRLTLAKLLPISERSSILPAAVRWWCCLMNLMPSARTGPRSKSTARSSAWSIRFCRSWMDSAAIPWRLPRPIIKACSTGALAPVR